MIKISVKGLANFMTSGASTQRKILRDFKLPKPEGIAQAKYYDPARQAIRKYHAQGNDASVLVGAVDELRKQAARAPTPRIVTKLDQNIRALECYMKYFAHSQFTVLPIPMLDLICGNVRITANPDLCVAYKGRQKLIKLELGAITPKPLAVKIITQVIFEAAGAGNLPIGPRDVVYLDVTRGTLHKGAKSRTRLKREIEDTCRNIEAMWTGIG